MTCTIGALMVGFGLMKRSARKLAMHNFSVKNHHDGWELKTFLIDPNKNYCKVMKICGFMQETDHPVYVGNQHAKIPIGGGTSIVEKDYSTLFLVHNLSDIICNFAQITGDYDMTSKVGDFASFKTKLKEKYGICINKMNIQSNFLKIYSSNNFLTLYLIGQYKNNQFVAEYAGENKNEIIKAATNNYWWLVVVTGAILFIFGLYLDITYVVNSINHVIHSKKYSQYMQGKESETL